MGEGRVQKMETPTHYGLTGRPIKNAKVPKKVRNGAQKSGMMTRNLEHQFFSSVIENLWLFLFWFCIFYMFTFLMRALCSLVTNWLGTFLAKLFVNTIFIIKPLIAKAFWTVKLIVIMIYYNCFGTPIRSVGRFVLIFLCIWGFEIVYFEEHPCWPLSWWTLHFVNFVCLYLCILWILGIL